jgi:selenium metabolism protein YedF
MAKKALKEIGVGDTFEILIDNETSRQNVERFLRDNGAETSCAEKDGVFALTARKVRDDMPSPDEAAYCTPPAPRPHAIAISRDRMGHGDDELGGILIKAFVNTIKEVSPLPSAIVFYNSGIFLTVEGSPLVEPLTDLESRGVKILVCGTCADYYKKKADVRVGTVSNMYDIVQTLTSAGHVVAP